MFPKKRRRLLVVPDPVGTGADLPKAIEALHKLLGDPFLSTGTP